MNNHAVTTYKGIWLDTLERCPSSYIGVRCHRSEGHSGHCRGLTLWPMKGERRSLEVWQWTDDPDDVLITATP